MVLLDDRGTPWVWLRSAARADLTCGEAGAFRARRAYPVGVPSDRRFRWSRATAEEDHHEADQRAGREREVAGSARDTSSSVGPGCRRRPPRPTVCGSGGPEGAPDRQHQPGGQHRAGEPRRPGSAARRGRTRARARTEVTRPGDRGDHDVPGRCRRTRRGRSRAVGDTTSCSTATPPGRRPQPLPDHAGDRAGHGERDHDARTADRRGLGRASARRPAGHSSVTTGIPAPAAA